MREKWNQYLVDGNFPLLLSVTEQEGAEIITGELCSADYKSFPIMKGVPRFKRGEVEESQIAEGFGYKWKEWHKKVTQIESDQYIKSREVAFSAILGVNTIMEAFSLFKDGMSCLDVGCGLAFSESLFNPNPKCNRFAVDIAHEAVEVAYEQTKEMENVFVAQADLLSMPFGKGFFDIIFSDGVIHHTRNSEKSFATLCSHLKIGGLIGIYVYNVKPFIRELVDEHLRRGTKWMSFISCMAFSEQIAKLGRSFKAFKEPLVIKEDIPLLDIKRGRYDLQKFIYDYFLKCFYNEDFGIEASILCNFDYYFPRYASHHTQQEVQHWFNANGIDEVKFIQPKGWEHSGYFASGRKVR